MKSSKKHKKTWGVIIGAFLILVLLSYLRITPFLFQLIFSHDIQLKKTDNRINILLLGIGGGSHDGPNLTDTIILANVDQDKNKVTLTSVPRDLWVPDLNGANKKINEAYAQGEDQKKGAGLTLAEAVVKKVTGQEIDYGVRIDFTGFEKAVDIVGGLDITVDNVLDDNEYPISGKEDDLCGNTESDVAAFVATDSAETDLQQKFSCRYKHLHFDTGSTHMDGQTALEFVRSRHALGVEGGDFARSKRQEKVITAFRDKLLSAQTLINPGKIISLYDILKGSIDTNIKQDEFDDFVRLAQKMQKAKIQSLVIDAGDEQTQRPGLLQIAPIAPEYDYLSVLIPRIGNGNFSEIHSYISCMITIDSCDFFKVKSVKP